MSRSHGVDQITTSRPETNTALGCFDIAIMRWADSDEDRSLAALVDEVFGFVQIPHARSDA